MYSQHTFIFPFKWECKTKKTNPSFSERTDLKSFQKALLPQTDRALPLPYWDSEIFEMNSANFGNYTYFYDYARKALFYTKEDKGILRKFSYKIPPHTQNTYEIVVWKEKNAQKDTYTLQVEKIELFAYGSGVAILVFFLKNNDYSTPEDILRINEFGRRIYPQYTIEGGIQATKANFLADSITLKIGEKVLSDCFEAAYHLDKFKLNTQMPLRLPHFIMGILGEKFKEQGKLLYQGEIAISPIIDDRMFVVAVYREDGYACELGIFDDNENAYRYASSDFWYKYVFVDKQSPSIRNRLMKNTELEKATYARWVEDKQLYGISRYSFMVLTNRSNDWLPDVVNRIYFPFILLCLVQRASVLRFSGEAALALSEKNDDSKNTRVKQVYEEYIHFINQIYFREITAQEQGIELYDKLQEVMRIEKHAQDLDREIAEFHQYLSNHEALRLTQLATWFLPATLIFSIAGMNHLREVDASQGLYSLFYWDFWIPTILSILLTVCVWLWFKYKKPS
ncbi:MAG: hypothetical protein IPL35_12760 [Sphingobacteriales bacterium]|nr:hypothetical protein [Sphingobacteriales bacterium]